MPHEPADGAQKRRASEHAEQPPFKVQKLALEAADEGDGDEIVVASGSIFGVQSENRGGGLGIDNTIIEKAQNVGEGNSMPGEVTGGREGYGTKVTGEKNEKKDGGERQKTDDLMSFPKQAKIGKMKESASKQATGQKTKDTVSRDSELETSKETGSVGNGQQNASGSTTIDLTEESETQSKISSDQAEKNDVEGRSTTKSVTSGTRPGGSTVACSEGLKAPSSVGKVQEHRPSPSGETQDNDESTAPKIYTQEQWDDLRDRANTSLKKLQAQIRVLKKEKEEWEEEKADLEVSLGQAKEVIAQQTANEKAARVQYKKQINQEKANEIDDVREDEKERYEKKLAKMNQKAKEEKQRFDAKTTSQEKKWKPEFNEEMKKLKKEVKEKDKKIEQLTTEKDHLVASNEKLVKKANAEEGRADRYKGGLKDCEGQLKAAHEGAEMARRELGLSKKALAEMAMDHDAALQRKAEQHQAEIRKRNVTFEARMNGHDQLQRQLIHEHRTATSFRMTAERQSREIKQLTEAAEKREAENRALKEAFQAGVLAGNQLGNDSASKANGDAASIEGK